MIYEISFNENYSPIRKIKNKHYSNEGNNSLRINLTIINKYNLINI